MHTVRKQLLLPDDQPSGRGVRVAILDTGVDLEHPDLADRVDRERSASFTLRDDLVDRNGHGTHLAGIIGGSGKASAGYLRGIAPECELVVLKTSEGRTNLEWTAERAMEHAIDAQVDIINYSHGTYPRGVGDAPWVWSQELSVLEEYFVEAERRGILCVVAAGNAGPIGGSIARPGGLECVLTVGAVDHHGVPLEDSSRGPFRRSDELRPGAVRRFDLEEHRNIVELQKPDVVAPGTITAPRARSCLNPEEAESSDPNYARYHGSSQATAVVTGVAALALELLRDRNAPAYGNVGRVLRRLLRESAVLLERHDSTEAGRGMIWWPKVVATLEDYITQPSFQQIVAYGNALRLM